MRNLYNHYVSNDTIFSRITEAETHHEETKKEKGEKTNFFHFFSQEKKTEKNAGLSGILKRLKLDDIDSGDILLFLILLFILIEGDDWELALILGLVLFLSLRGDDPM